MKKKTDMWLKSFGSKSQASGKSFFLDKQEKVKSLFPLQETVALPAIFCIYKVYIIGITSWIYRPSIDIEWNKCNQAKNIYFLISSQAENVRS